MKNFLKLLFLQAKSVRQLVLSHVDLLDKFSMKDINKMGCLSDEEAECLQSWVEDGCVSGKSLPQNKVNRNQ